MRVARNAALDHLRSRRQIPVDEVRISENGHEQTSLEYTHALKAALAELPESQREVLVLRHIGGLSPTEIAERPGKDRGVDSRDCTTAGARRSRFRSGSKEWLP